MSELTPDPKPSLKDLIDARLPPGMQAGVPTIGETLWYSLTEQDRLHIGRDSEASKEGEVLPLIVTRASEAGVSGQVLVNGDHSVFVTDRQEGTGPGNWAWRVAAQPILLPTAKPSRRPSRAKPK